MNKLLAAATALTLAFYVPRASATSNFIFVANTAENTVSKIDVTIPAEVARYPTWFGTAPVPFGPAPSRIARDASGNAYVLDRFFSCTLPGSPPTVVNHLPVLFKIAPTGGTLGVDTSSGSGIAALLPMTDTTNLGHIDLTEITDKRISWASEIGTPGVMPVGDDGALGRALCMDKSGYLWVGMNGTNRYYKVDPSNGIVMAGPIPAGHSPYGAQVDVNGKLWSMNSSSLSEIDTLSPSTVAPTPINLPAGHSAYSISIYNDCTTTPAKVTVYLSDGTNTYTAYDPQTHSFSSNPPAIKVSSISIGVDSKGNIVSGVSGTGQIVKHSPSGTLVWNQPGTSTCSSNCASPIGPAIPDFHGIIIDDYDDVWAVDRNNDQVVKYSGSNGAYVATVKVGDQPYTYGNSPPPTCGGSTVTGVATYNKDKSDCAKGSICFDYTVPTGTAGAGTVDLSLELYQNGAVVNTLTSGPLTTSGTYCFTNFLAGLDASVGGFDWKMTATFTATGTTVPPVVVGTTGEGFVPGKNNDCPLTPPPGCAQVTGEAHCLPNGDYSYTFNVTHNSGNVMSQVLLTPVKGSTFTLTPQLTNLSPPLAGGQSATVTTNIRNAKPGDNVCFFVCLMSETAPCCIVQVCLTMPVCGGIENPATTAKPPNPTNRPNQTNPPSVAPPPRRPPLRDRRRP